MKSCTKSYTESYTVLTAHDDLNTHVDDIEFLHSLGMLHNPTDSGRK